MLKQIKNSCWCAMILIGAVAFQNLQAQNTANTTDTKPSADETTAKANAELEKKAVEWAAELKLNDAAKEKRVSDAVATHLKAVRDWNNEHPFTTVPAGINPATGNKLSELDRQVIANSAIPASVHENLMTALKNELTAEQVEMILDKYTIGKVTFTLKGYKAIVPDLTNEEETKILEHLKQAREQSIDYKNMRQISAIFEIYKTKCEQYLNSNGRNWRQLYKAYTDKVKAEKQKEKTN
jgi:Protein of unknown function (DUF3826)